jgi:hypothetical protein
MYSENIEVSGSSFNTQFDLSTFSKGIYFLRVIDENYISINKKIIKE